MNLVKVTSFLFFLSTHRPRRANGAEKIPVNLVKVTSIFLTILSSSPQLPPHTVTPHGWELPLIDLVEDRLVLSYQVKIITTETTIL